MNKNKTSKSSNFKKSFKMLSMPRKLLLLLGLGILIVSTLPAMLVLIIGLLPTITVLITDHKNSGKLVVVGCFNLAGLFACFMNIINHFDLDNAFSILADPFNLIVMLGSAALGFIVYHETPNLFVFLSKLSAQKRLVKIDKKLQRITEEWGPEIIEDQVNKLVH